MRVAVREVRQRIEAAILDALEDDGTKHAEGRAFLASREVISALARQLGFTEADATVLDVAEVPS
jgi:hypothetical protein